MKRANVGTLRNNLSRYLEIVRRGETVEILDRKTPIARLTPIDPTTKPARGSLSPWMEKLVREGRVRPPSRRLPARFLDDIPGDRRARVVDALLDERRTGR
jgi:prevent-host-death family protein